MKKNVIVSLADANYFPLLEELIDSIKRFQESENIAICILDAGLTKEQKDLLEKFREIENEKSNPSIKKFFQKAKNFWKN